ncbi:MAG: hypothetical protein ACPH3N_00695 [Alcanivorax sediminis]|uniref:hypothetical protein n=1 Tax=Alcanivorax sediminis TaxID=2663008 RepID=UPI003C617803
MAKKHRELANLTANGTSPRLEIPEGGDHVISCADGISFGGGTLTINTFTQDGDALAGPAEFTQTAEFEPFVATLGYGTHISATLSGATSPTDFIIYISPAV